MLDRILSELLQRFFDQLKAVSPVWFLAFAVAAMVSSPNVRRLSGRARSLVSWGILVTTIVGAMFWAWSLLWASDDAYITFRYAENLARGHGLVYNPGERVEGYTDFLWAVIAAAVIWFKGDPGKATIILNLASFVALLLLIERLGRRLRITRTLISIATLLLAANYTMASFATACIESMFAAMLATLALERVASGHPLAGGLAGVAAAMTHPDHGIFYAAMGLALLLGRPRRKELVYFAAPFVAVFVPYFLWRWSYYGDLMPNTFYAKSADKGYFDQGIRYLLTTVVGAGFGLSLPLGVLGAYQIRNTFIGRYAIILLPIYLFYVVKVGGDFMLGRFFVPAIPVWLLLVDAGHRWLISQGHFRSALSLALPAVAIALPISVVKSSEIYHGIADERSWVNVSNFANMDVNAYGQVLGRSLHQQLTARGHTPKIALWCIGMAGYYSKLPIFDMRGLTSRSVAHLPIAERGRPGHEKTATAGLVVESKSELSELAVYPAPYAQLGTAAVAGGQFSLVRYDPNLLAQLPPNSGLLSFPSHLDAYVSQLPKKPSHVLACDLWHQREYYFSVNDDEARRTRITQAVVSADPTLGGLEGLLLDTRDPSRVGYKSLRKWGFAEGDPAWTAEGQGSAWLVDDLRAGQEYPLGRQGRFVNTFVPPDKEIATGRLVSPEFVIQGDLVTLWVGGGQLPDTEIIQFLVDEQPVRSATGCNTDWMGQRFWNVSQYKGKSARYVITDSGTGSWAHLLVDEIVEWGRQ